MGSGVLRFLAAKFVRRELVLQLLFLLAFAVALSDVVALGQSVKNF